MLRYVSRRIKDTVERTYNVLEAGRTWTYGNEGVGVYEGSKNEPLCDENKHQRRFNHSIFELQPKIPIVIFKNDTKEEIKLKNICKFQPRFASSNASADDSGSSSSDGQDFHERIHRKHHCKFQRNFVEALTWSSALICGWYASQIVCMRRRHLRNGWNGQCKFAKLLIQPSQAFHSTVLSHWARAAPEHQPAGFIWKLNNETHSKFVADEFTQEKFAHENNDKLKNDEKIDTTANQQVSTTTIDGAVNNLLSILGDIEYQLGVESIRSNRYDLAVSHFKLAASHSHASGAYNLGVCYEKGVGVEKNLKKALDCYMIAYSMGHAKSAYNVGVFHAHGMANLPKNRKVARLCFEEAAKLGLNEAKKTLGISQMQRVDQTFLPQATMRQSQPIVVAV